MKFTNLALPAILPGIPTATFLSLTLGELGVFCYQRRGFPMRRLMLILVALSFLGAMSGCKHACSHGMCDCEYDDYCSSRSPWIRYGGAPMVGHVAGPAETFAAPLPAAPEAKKGL